MVQTHVYGLHQMSTKTLFVYLFSQPTTKRKCAFGNCTYFTSIHITGKIWTAVQKNNIWTAKQTKPKSNKIRTNSYHCSRSVLSIWQWSVNHGVCVKITMPLVIPSVGLQNLQPTSMTTSDEHTFAAFRLQFLSEAVSVPISGLYQLSLSVASFNKPLSQIVS